MPNLNILINMKNLLLILSIIGIAFAACKKDAMKVLPPDSIETTLVSDSSKSKKQPKVEWWHPIKYSDFKAAYMRNRPGGEGC